MIYISDASQMEMKRVGGLFVAFLAASFGAGHGWTDRGFAECQPSSLRAIDISFQSDVQMLQTTAVPDSSRANVSRYDQWIGVNIARAPGGSQLLVKRLQEATAMVSVMATQVVSTITESGLVVAAFANSGAYATTVNVDGASVVYVYIPVFSFPALPTTGTLITLLTQDLAGLSGWVEAYPALVTIADDTNSATSNEALSAVGDPHLRNIHGERFDLMQPGKHVLVHIPRRESIENTLLHVQAVARTLGDLCADTYFMNINVSGKWPSALQPGGFIFRADDPDSGAESKWMSFHGMSNGVQMKVVHGKTQQGIRYLNFFVKHLDRTGFPVGGLLGEDDHEEASTPSPECQLRISLKSNTALD